jgi:Ca2+:H+ antiporter
VKQLLKLLLVFIPVSMAAEWQHWDAVWIFASCCLAIIPLAMYMGEATEEISLYAGPKIGGFLNATFGNATEMIIAFFALREGLFDVVKASIAGSIMGNVLLVLGASMLVGGLKYKIQCFSRQVAEVSTSMLTFSVIGLCVPAVFLHTVKPELLDTWQYEPVSLAVAGIMLVIYIFGLYFSFVTHKDIYGTEDHEEGLSKWSLKKAISVLLVTTVMIALESEFLVGAIAPATQTWGISEFFVGIILIPIVGNAAEHSTAIWMARKNKMNVALEIAIGSSLQIVLFVMPILILAGALMGRTMSVVFNEFELVSLIVSVLIANRVAGDGESNWLEGVQLMAVYVIIAVCFLWL